MAGRRTGVPVEFLDGAAFESVDGLPAPHRDVAWDLLDHLSENPFVGRPLHAHPVVGDLAGTRSIYVIDFHRELIGHPPPYRIVYRLMPSEELLERIQVIWAGARDDLAVYRVAARRLARQRGR